MIDLFHERLTNEVHAFFWSLSCLQGAYGNERCNQSIGLGTCWAGLLQGALLSLPSMKEIMGIPAGHLHHYPLMLGYPKLKSYSRLPERKPPKISFK